MGANTAKLCWCQTSEQPSEDEQHCGTAAFQEVLKDAPPEKPDQTCKDEHAPSLDVLKDVPPEKPDQTCKDEHTPSLDVLKDVPPEKLDQPCKTKLLNDLALSIADWQSIARLLGLTEAEVAEIDEDNKNAKQKRMKMLQKWWEKLGRQATYRKLIEVFIKMKHTDLVEKLCNLLQEDSSDPRSTSELQNCSQSDLETANKRIRSDYANILKYKYQFEVPSILTLQWPPPPTFKVFNLAMISERELKYGTNDEMVKLLLRGDVSGVVSRSNPVTLEKISNSLHSRGRKVILIEGAPGAGKSTLSWHLCKMWQAGRLFQEFEIVLFVQLREPTIQSAQSLEELFPAELPSKKDIVSAIQYCDGHQVLIILDSWDEFQPGLHKQSVIKNLICNPSLLKMQFSALIITSRPIATAKLQRCVSQRIEIVGFVQDEVKRYFTAAIRDDQMVQKLTDNLKERPVIEASCYLPLNTAIVAHLFLALNHTLPDTLHEVFTSLVICCIKRHLERQTAEGEDTPEPEISSLDNLPPDIQEQFNKLCKLAYHGVMKNKVTFSKTDLQSFELPAQLSTLSLMQGVVSFTALEQTNLYNFLHLSTQELLAAFFISKMQPQKQYEIFNTLFEKPRFANVFKFYAAFTKLQTKGIQDTVSKIVESRNMTLILSLLHCLYEAQDDTLCQSVASQLHKKLDLTKQSMSPVDCLAVGYFARRVCSTTTAEFKLTLSLDQLDEYLATLLMKELSKCSISQSETAAVTEGTANLYLDLVKGRKFTAKHGKIMGKLGPCLKVLK